MASLALMTNCPNERGASCRSKASLNSSSPIKLSKPATATSKIRGQTREVGGTSATVAVGVKLDEFDDITPSSDYLDRRRRGSVRMIYSALSSELRCRK